MKRILFATILCSAGLSADEAQERASIEKVIAAVNDPVKRAALFTKDADCPVDFDGLIELHKRYGPDLMIGMDETWTELTMPRVVPRSIRLITADVAMVDGVSTIRGAITLARLVPLLFVMKKEGAAWRINAVRLLPRATLASPSPAAP